MLYHCDIFMPAKIKNAPSMFLMLAPTNHALTAAETDRYGKITIPKRIDFSGKDIIEAEILNGVVNKIVVRLPYDSTRDAIYVALLDGTLKTVWFNKRNDKHHTLDRTKYASH